MSGDSSLERPPLVARRFLELLAPARIREELAGDLHELFLSKCQTTSVRAARRWYWRQVAHALVTANFFDVLGVDA